MSRLAAEHGELLTALQSGDRELLMAAVERHITVRTPGPAA
jgi:DNA-binding FadR family transcriptional regulator